MKSTSNKGKKLTDYRKYIGKEQYRQFEVESVEDDLITMSVSSEVPYLREYGYEILSHNPQSVITARLDASAPFLCNHDENAFVGVVEKHWFNNRKLYVTVRLSPHSEFARQVGAEIKDGFRPNVSVGYVIHSMVEGESINGIRSLIADPWEILEVSTVTVPADYKVGVGRNHKGVNMEKDIKADTDSVEEEVVEDTVEEVAEETPETELEAKSDISIEEVTEEVVAEAVEEAVAEVVEETPTQDGADEVAETEETDMKDNEKKSGLEGADVAKREAEVREITTLAVEHSMTDKLPNWIAEGRSVESVSAEILKAKRSASPTPSAPAVHTTKRDNSLGEAVAAYLRGDNSEVNERGIDQARASGRAVTPDSFYVPTDMPIIPKRAVAGMFKRTGTDISNTGVYAAGAEFLTWEETLREGAKLAALGGEILVVNALPEMPYFATPTTASMAHATGSASDTEATVGQVVWSPKRIAANYSFSNLLGRLNGVYDFEGALYNDLLAEGIRKFEQQVFAGTGANNVTGIAYDTNIATYDFSSSFDLGAAYELRRLVTKNNANSAAGAYLVSSLIYNQAASSGSFGAGSAGKSIIDQIQATNRVVETNYFPTFISGSQVAVFGDWSKVTAVMVGPLTIHRDATTLVDSGKTRLVLESYVDSKARQPGALIKATGIKYEGFPNG